MNQDLIRFRQAADRENRGRRPIRRRYSPTLQQQAIDYWRKRRPEEGLRRIAAALGVAPWTLHRWLRASHTRSRLQPVQVIAAERAPDAAALVVTLTADGRPRVEGLTVKMAARLVTLLR